MDEQAVVYDQIEALDCWTLDHLVDIAKGALNVPPDDADVASLSGGERRRVALCRLLLEQPDVLLLDEPTNHLDAESVRWLEGYLAEYRGTVLAITHDRYFLNQVAGFILEVDRSSLYAYTGNYSTWLETKQRRLNLESKADGRRAKAMQEELAWIRQVRGPGTPRDAPGRRLAGPGTAVSRRPDPAPHPARLVPTNPPSRLSPLPSEPQGSKGQQKKSKARIAAFANTKEEDLRLRSERRFLSGAIAIPPAPRVGSPIVRMEGVSLALGGRQLIRDLSFNLAPGSIVGVVGPNGAGKSTLMRLIAAELAPDKGEVEVGRMVTLGHIEQSRHLEPDETVGSVISEGLSEIDVGASRPVPMMAWLSKFNLSQMAKKPVKALSGGERSRVHLARTLKHPCNVLIMDEPTNDLDVDTLRSLEEALEDYNGCAFIVSHDRYFLDRLCTHTISFEGEGDVVWHPGSWTEYEQYRKEKLPHYHARAQARLDGSNRGGAAKKLS